MYRSLKSWMSWNSSWFRFIRFLWEVVLLGLVCTSLAPPVCTSFLMRASRPIESSFFSRSQKLLIPSTWFKYQSRIVTSAQQKGYTDSHPALFQFSHSIFQHSLVVGNRILRKIRYFGFWQYDSQEDQVLRVLSTSHSWDISQHQIHSWT